MAKYSTSSPWSKTKIRNSQYLDILSIRAVPKQPDDVLYTIEVQYTHRPDLLAYDLYRDHGLWWVFAQRNMDIIQDPVYDIEPGVEIILPKMSNLIKYLK